MSITSITPQETLAKAPFNDSRADLILRSSDAVHFRVFKVILSLASAIFSDMFNIPPPISKSPDDEIQVVPLSENSEALDLCLRHIYPLQNPEVVPLRDANTLAEFADKYQVDALEKSIRRYLMDNIEHDPAGVYAIAVTYGYKSVGKQAAQSCLNIPFDRLQSPFVRCATAEHFADLLRYHVACGEAASAVPSERAWFSSLGQTVSFISMGGRTSCSSCSVQDFMDQNSNAHGKRYGPMCVWNYLHRSGIVLARHPAAEAVAREDFILKGYNCPSCPLDYRGQMAELSRVLGREVKKAVGRVLLPEAVTTRGTAIPTSSSGNIDYGEYS